MEGGNGRNRGKTATLDSRYVLCTEEEMRAAAGERVEEKRMKWRGSKVQQCVHLNVTVMLSSTLMQPF